MQLHERLAHGTEPERGDVFQVPFSELKTKIHLELIQDLGRQLFNTAIDPATLRARVEAELHERLSTEAGIAREDRDRIAVELTADILGHGPIERLLESSLDGLVEAHVECGGRGRGDSVKGPAAGGGSDRWAGAGSWPIGRSACRIASSWVSAVKRFDQSVT